MKKFLVFTILLLSSFSKSFACGYSPFGEDTRYCLFHPEYFKYHQYKSFYYNANLFGFESDVFENRNAYFEANELDWFSYTNKKVDIEAISFFLNKAKFTDIRHDSENAFINYLFQHKKWDAITYLTFAKRCENSSNYNYEDPWERKPIDWNTKSLLLLNELLAKEKSEKNFYFKRKYNFLAIRLAYYVGKPKLVADIFNFKFKNSKKDYLYYWSSFFNALVDESPTKMNDVAALLEHSPEKFYASYYFFHEKFELQKALSFAKTKEDVANIYGYASIQKVDQNLDYLKVIYKNSPKSKLFGFLLLREINKIEDWIYTPYYTNYLPSTRQFGYWNNEEITTTKTLRARSEKDRIYAKKVLEFVQSISVSQVNDPVLLEASKIQLLLMTKEYAKCVSKIKQFEKTHPNENVTAQLEKIKALAITCNQVYGKAIINPEIMPTLQKYKNDSRFIFALGRELEYRGNISDGIALMSLSNSNQQTNYDSSDVEWKGNPIANSQYMDEFYSYFDYLDFVYDADQLHQIIATAELKANSGSNNFVYDHIKKDLPFLKDLLGTKYIREDRLSNALKTFKSIGDQYWTANYNAWERGEYNEAYAFEQNPFFKFKHTEVFINPQEKFIVTKLSVTEHLIKYLNLANNPKTIDRDYYYFLIANCYYNMSDSGNSWMMRRYSCYTYTGDENYMNQSYSDEREYRLNLKAQHYYTLAFKNAKTDKFKALCLRMADFATKYPNNFDRLKKQYPQYYQDLSSCDNLSAYFRQRR